MYLMIMQDKKKEADRPMFLSSLNIVVFICMGQFAHAPDGSYKNSRYKAWAINVRLINSVTPVEHKWSNWLLQMAPDILRCFIFNIFIIIVLICWQIITNPPIYSGQKEKVRNLFKMKCYIFTASLLYCLRYKVVVILIIKKFL